MSRVLQRGGHSNYSAAWNPRDQSWSIELAADRRQRHGGDSATVIDIPALENRNGDTEARFAVLAPDPADEEAAAFAAHAIFDFLWDDDQDAEAWQPPVLRIVMVRDATGARHQFEPPPPALAGPPMALPEPRAKADWPELGRLGQAVM